MNRFLSRIPGSLQTWILTLTILISVAVLSISEIVSSRASVAAVEDFMGEETRRAAEHLANLLERLGVAGVSNPAFLTEQHRILEIEPYTRRVDVYLLDDHTGEEQLKLIQSSSSLGDRVMEGAEIEALYGDRTITLTWEENRHRQILAAHPVHFPGGQRGLVSVMNSLAVADKIQAFHGRIRIFAILGNALLLTGAVILLFRMTFYRHLRHLTTVMGLFRRGKSSVRASERLPGEIGRLALHFNAMLAEIEKYQNSMKQQVTEATRELSEKNRELNNLNLQLFEIQRRLAQAERLALAGQLAAMFAHEVGSPLCAVSTHLQILMENPGLAPRVRDRLRMAAEQVDRISEIVQQHLETTRETPVSQRFDLAETVRRVFGLLQPVIEMRGIRCRFEAPPAPLPVRGEPDRLQQVFVNLFNNALDAVQDGGSIEVAASVENLATGRAACVQVKDDGEGVPEENLELIFEPFFSTKKEGKRFGLGLSVSREIVRRQGGALTVSNLPAGGACFTLTLPLEKQGQTEGNP